MGWKIRMFNEDGTISDQTEFEWSDSPDLDGKQPKIPGCGDNRKDYGITWDREPLRKKEV